MSCIIGIDPGLRYTGWGVIAARGNRVSFVASGRIASDASAALAMRLLQIYEGLQIVFKTHSPVQAAVEQTFVNKDAGATLKLGQARGIALLVPALFQVPVSEYAPNLVKKTVVGTGHAQKEQIRMMVQRLLPHASCDTPDAADALAIAVCHAYHCGQGAHRLQCALEKEVTPRQKIC